MHCMLCGTSLEDADDFVTAYDNGPFGMSEPKEIGHLCTNCFEDMGEEG